MEVMDQAYERYSKSNLAVLSLKHAMAVRLCYYKSLNMAHKRRRDGGLFDSLRTFFGCQLLHGYGERS